MKIKEVHVFGFGKLHHLNLNFKQFQIIFGNNEAGKTTLINFIKGILFGFKDKRNKGLSYVPKDGTQMGGELLIEADGKDYLLKRTAGKRGGNLTVKDSAGKELPAQTLTDLLGPINETTYDSLFYFGAVGFKQVEDLNRDELAQRIRQVGVTDINHWTALEKENAEAADQIYKVRGQKPELNRLLKEYSRLEKKVQDAKANYSNYQELLKKEKALKAEQKQQQIEYQEKKKQLDQVENDQKDWDRYAKLKGLQAEKPEVTEGFSDNDWQELQKLASQIKAQQAEIENDKRQIAEFEKQPPKGQAEFSLFQQNEAKIGELRSSLSQITRSVQQLGIDENKLENSKSNLNQAINFAGGPDTTEFSEAEKGKISELQFQSQGLSNEQAKAKGQTETRSQAPQTKSKAPFGLMGAGAVLALVGLLLGGSLLAVMLVLGIALVGLGGYLYWKENQPVNEKSHVPSEEEIKQQLAGIKSEIAGINEDHHLAASFNDWQNVNSYINQREKTKSEVKNEEENVTEQKQKLQKYFSDWDFCQPYLQLDPEQDFGVQLSALNGFLSGLDDIKKQMENRKFKINQLQDSQRKHLEAKEELTKQEDQFLQQRGVSSVSEFQDQFNKQQEIAKKLARMHDLQAELTPEKQAQLASYQNVDDLNERLQNLKSEVNALDQEIYDNAVRLTEKQTRIKGMEEDGTFTKFNQELANKKAEINDLTEKWLIYTLSNQWIERVLNEASQGRLPLVKKQAQDFFATLTDGHYDKIIYNKTGIEVETQNGTKFKVAELSRGTMKQLYLALVFALTLAFASEFPMPIMIDDGFVDFDAGRTENAIKLMKQVAEADQVLYFTADNRIFEAVDENNVINLGKEEEDE